MNKSVDNQKENEKQVRYLTSSLMSLCGVDVSDMVDYTGNTASSIRNWMAGRGNFVPFIEILIDMETRVREGRTTGLPNGAVQMAVIRRYLETGGAPDILEMVNAEPSETSDAQPFATMAERMNDFERRLSAIEELVD